MFRFFKIIVSCSPSWGLSMDPLIRVSRLISVIDEPTLSKTSPNYNPWSTELVAGVTKDFKCLSFSWFFFNEVSNDFWSMRMGNQITFLMWFTNAVIRIQSPIKQLPKRAGQERVFNMILQGRLNFVEKWFILRTLLNEISKRGD